MIRVLGILAAWIAEGAALAAVATPAPSLRIVALGLAAHGAAAVAAAAGFGAGRADERFLAGGVVLSLPVLGLVGLTAIRAWERIVPPKATSTEHPSGSDLPTPEVELEPLDRVFDWLQGQVAVQPLADMIHSGDPSMQRWAIQALGRRTDALAVELLRDALTAADRDVQIAASTALLRLEERLTAQIARAEEACRADARASTWAALGTACRAYHASRLLEPVMERHWLGRAEASYRRALAQAPDDVLVQEALARLLLALDRADEAETLARAVLAARSGPESAMLLAEALFARARWDELTALARATVAAGHGSDALAWWAGETA